MDKGKGEVTYLITVYGVVQGVGFRPHVYRLAQKYRIKGTVCNAGGLVEMTVSCREEELAAFLDALKSDRSGSWKVGEVTVRQVPHIAFADFTIAESSGREGLGILPHDLATCDDCLAELGDTGDRRFANPFISCAACGPRFTVIEKTPYDRHNTVMTDFTMCDSCRREYENPADRRFHAQTISCNDCGPRLMMGELTDARALDRACGILNGGDIVAVKGIGGYHFCASPYDNAAVERLRQLKGREQKPFAVMFGSVGDIREHCHVSVEEERLLKTPARPIVLLTLKTDKMAPLTNMGSLYCGAFLPYTPLQTLLITRCGELIMTSANVSNKPIIRDDDEIHQLGDPLLGGVLYHKRRILRPVDDSVARVVNQKPQLIRRSRGYVPHPHRLPAAAKAPLFAAGADLKSAFCLVRGGDAVVSQYFGDLGEGSVLAEYEREFSDLCALLGIVPERVVCDMHPLYASSAFARRLGLPVTPVQHHHAHIAAVMAEHRLAGRVVGVAFDGVGYGTDGNVWGGEFLACEGAEFRRLAHLKNVLLLGGDTASTDAKKTAVGYLAAGGLTDFAEHPQKELILSGLRHQVNTALYSSLGRLFDCVSALLGIKDFNTYEGECATLLEREAILARRANTEPLFAPFTFSEKNGIMEIDYSPVLIFIAENKDKLGRGALALGFHTAVADMTVSVCRLLCARENTRTVCLGGGVFQNGLLLESVFSMLCAQGYAVYYNMAYPPDDGVISLGQAYVGMLRLGQDEIFS